MQNPPTQAAASIWADVRSGAAEAQPALLSRFFLLTFGDLKRYVFTYWFAFPALKPPAPFQQLGAAALAERVGEGAAAKVGEVGVGWGSRGTHHLQSN
jgi:ubiquitin-like modifier-activating enzyme ATG7